MEQEPQHPASSQEMPGTDPSPSVVHSTVDEGPGIPRSQAVRLPCGLVVGGGPVYPEFPLPLDPSSPGAAERCLHEAEELLRAAAGRVEGAVFGLDLCGPRQLAGWPSLVSRLHETGERFRRSAGLSAAVRVTLPAADENVRLAAEAGADIISLETANGLPLFQRALRASDIRGLIAALVLSGATAAAGPATRAAEALRGSGAVFGGDCARPFIRQMLMDLQEDGALEPVCAIALTVCAVRTLASYEAGASGPAQDGAWESLIVKAIQGCPVSLSGTRPWEPRVAAMADLWNSGGTVEQTLDDCRALGRGQAPAASGRAPAGALSHILSAGSILEVAEAIQTCEKPYQRAVAAAYAAATILGEGGAEAEPPLAAPDRELSLRMAEELILLPDSDQELLEQVGGTYGHSILSGEMNL